MDTQRTVFRRVRGRIVPIRVKDNRKDLGKAALATAGGAAGAYVAGRLGPHFGFASAVPRIRKRMSFKIGKVAGLGALLSVGLASSAVSRIVGRQQPKFQEEAAAVTAAGVALLLPRVARFGRARKMAAAMKLALGR